LKYRDKKEDETWNSYLIKIFRDGKHVRYPDFLDDYFSDESKLLAYKEGIKQDAENKKNAEKNKTKKKKVKVDKNKVTFAKKPDRLKNKKKEQGYLF